MTPRKRRSKAQMSTLARQIYEVLAADHPQSVRHLFYRMTDPRLEEPVEKSEAGYVTVQRLTVTMRREGLIPYGWITDATRRGYFTDTWNDPAGGFASLTLTWEAARNIAAEARGRPVHVLYVGDYDPAGVLIDREIESELRRHLPAAEIHFHRLAITAEQIALMGLPTKPAKAGDRRGGFAGGTVEAEAMPASVLRGLLSDAIEVFVDPRQLAVLEAAEESERGHASGVRRMSGRSPSTASATPTQRRQVARQAAIAAEVRAACDALKRAFAAGKEVRDDLELVDHDLWEHAK